MYLQGFGNYHATEARPGALPTRQNSPQQCEYGLYAEQLSGTAFTKARHANLHSWLYRSLPSVVQNNYKPFHRAIQSPAAELQAPNPYRWSPLPPPVQSCDFIDGLFHLARTSSLNAYLYECNQSMESRYVRNHDGEWLFVPYAGEISLLTEFGPLDIKPGMIAVIPRGVCFKVKLLDKRAAGYLCENQGEPLTLPQLGPIGANGLANPRHFLYPQAQFEEKQSEVELLAKYQGQWWQTQSPHSPLNVLAWHGNYAPYCYDLSLFNTINTVSFDHPDPSIFTVLTSATANPGVANLDFVIFPPRWMVAEHTFRPPYYHRNIMSELMGLIEGVYDAKQDGFLPGGVSIHNCMVPHGPDRATFEAASREELKPARYQNTLAFMFETNEPWLLTEQALAHPCLQQDYAQCWQDLKQVFFG